MADFKIGDKVKLVKMTTRLNKYNEKIGKIIKDGGKQRIPTGFRKLGKGFTTEEGQQQWLIELDDPKKTIVLPEINLEKIP